MGYQVGRKCAATCRVQKIYSLPRDISPAQVEANNKEHTGAVGCGEIPKVSPADKLAWSYANHLVLNPKYPTVDRYPNPVKPFRLYKPA